MDYNILDISTEVLSGYNLKEPPIDPYFIAKQEGIIIQTIDIDDPFFGRIEFLRDIGKYVIFCQEYNLHNPNPIHRYTISHEIGHYFIEAHRKLLEQGKSHNSKPGLIHNNILETEADEFASYLLIPENYLSREIRKKGYLGLKEIIDISKKCIVSITSTAIRYVKSTSEISVVVVTENNKIKFAISSSKASELNFNWIDSVPVNSLTSKLIASPKLKEVFSESCPIYQWFPNSRESGEIWEEVYVLGYTNWVLTLLSITSDK